MEIRERIQKVLDENPDLSPRGVSLKAGLSDSMLHKYLTGATRTMSFENLKAVAEALGVNPRWLMFGDMPERPDEKLAYLYDHLPDYRKRQAIRIIEALAEDGEEAAQINGA